MDFIIEKLSNIFLHRALILPTLSYIENDASVIYLIYIFADIRPPLLADKLSDLHFRSYILSTDRNSIENGITYFSGRAPAFLASPKKKQLNPTFMAYLLLRETNRERRDRNDIGTTGGSGENGFQAITTPEYFNDEMLVEG